MFDIGGAEMLVLGLIALLVLGPAELPQILRNIGRIVARMRHFAHELRHDVDNLDAPHYFVPPPDADDLFTAPEDKTHAAELTRDN